VATFPQWEYDLLKALGAPASQNNLTALNLWAQSEGSVTNNPIATSGKGAGATKCVAQCGTPSPIYEYDNEADGVAQMAGFLKGSYYTAVVRAFVQDAGLAAIYQAINGSSWCKGCQNGQYPVDLAQAVGGKATSANPTVGTGSGGTATSAGGAGGATSSGGGTNLSQCVIQLPGFLFFSGPCFLTKGGVKWLSGVAALGVGGALAGFGIVLLASAVGKSTGATAAVGKVAKTVGVGASLLAGQPEAAAGIEGASLLKGGGGSSAKSTKSKSAPAPKAPEVPTAGRRESRQIERNYQSTVRQQGPIGPRGGNPTSTRIASQRRSTPGARPTTSEAQRRRRESRAGQPF
jgi:hypothetical protein